VFDHICLDWGSVRTGISYGDSQSGLIVPEMKTCLTQDIFVFIEKKLLKSSFTTIVVGLPSNFHGEPTEITANIISFITDLNKIFPEMIVQTINENGSTKFAKSSNIKDKGMINNVAAIKILEYYFKKVTKNS
jgi:RNase H-fold protein (predicted Holliday junction resolvase)